MDAKIRNGIIELGSCNFFRAKRRKIAGKLLISRNFACFAGKKYYNLGVVLRSGWFCPGR